MLRVRLGNGQFNLPENARRLAGTALALEIFMLALLFVIATPEAASHGASSL
jgi:hypothetical protein